MAISTEVRRAGPFEGNGSQADFPFSFKVLAASQVRPVISTDGGETESDLPTTDFTVTLSADQDVTAGGTVHLTTPLPQGSILTIISAVPYLQPVVFTNRGGFYPEILNQALDRATAQIQQIAEKQARSLAVPTTSVKTPEQLTQELLSAQKEAQAQADAAAKSAAAAKESETKTAEYAEAALVLEPYGPEVKIVADNVQAVVSVSGVVEGVKSVASVAGQVQIVVDNIEPVQTAADDIESIRQAPGHAATATAAASEAEVSKNAAETAANLADASQKLAKQWAIQTSDPVEGEYFGAKYYADRAKASDDSAASILVSVTAEGAKQVKAVNDAGAARLLEIETAGQTSADAAAASATAAAESAAASDASAKASASSQKSAADSQAAALASQTAAKTSETNAKSSETAASGSATAASGSATAAASSASAAKASQDAAAKSQTAAAGSATAAATSATAAAASQTAAKTSETNAAASQTAAAGSATAAKTSETNSKTSETAAASSKTAAAGSATAAANSATAAATSAKAAKASEDKAKEYATQASSGQMQADWLETDATAKAYIQSVPIIDGVNSRGLSDIIHFGVCSTASATAEKVIACPGFELHEGGRIAVKFSLGNSAPVASTTLNVNGVGGKPVKWRGANLPYASILVQNAVYEFVYTNGVYELVGDLVRDIVYQAAASTAGEYPVIIKGNPGGTSTTTNVLYAAGVTLNPATGVLTAPTFKGALSGKATSAAAADAATKAAQDASGNVITTTYATKTEVASGLGTKLDKTAKAVTAAAADTATTASKLGTVDVGAATTPIYLKAGVATAGTPLAKVATSGAYADLSGGPDLTPYAKKTDVTTSLASYVTLTKLQTDLEAYAKKTDVPDVAALQTRVAALETSVKEIEDAFTTFCTEHGIT